MIHNADQIEKARRWGLIILLPLSLLIGWMEARAQDAFQVTAPECPDCFTFFEDSKRVWNGPVQILLNAKDRPSWASIADIERSIQKNLDHIKTYADIPLIYGGRTNLTHIEGYARERENTVIIQFEDLVGARQGHAWIWWNWEGNNNVNYGEVSFDYKIPEICLDGIALHELLHVLNIAHNEDTQNSIMAANPYNSCVYQATLRLDDIKAVQDLYASTPNRSPSITSEGCLYIPEIVYKGEIIQGTICDPRTAEIIYE